MLRGPAVAALLLLIVLCGTGCDATNSQTGANVKKSSFPVVVGAVDADAPEEFTTTESGLKYRIRRKSDGKKPNSKSTVTVHYRGRLTDGNGEIFDTSYGTGGTPAQFAMNGVVPGWTEGLQLIGEGGMIELEIPSALGYGENGQPPTIPSNVTLHFIVELVSVGDDMNSSDEQHNHKHTSGLQHSDPVSGQTSDQAAKKALDKIRSTPEGRAAADRLASKDDQLTAFQRANGISDRIAEAAIKEWVTNHGGNFDWNLEEVKIICLRRR